MNIDLTTCDKEKIHQFTCVQGHGAFVVVSSLDFKIRHISENAPGFFELKENHVTLIGLRLNDLFSLELAKNIQDKIRGPLKNKKSIFFSFQDRKLLDVYLYQLSESLIGIEFEENPKLDDSDDSGRLNDYIQEMQGCRTLSEAATAACRAVRLISGFDRVMIYRFFPPSMFGEVIAEDKVAYAHSFLNHRFPATDIPKPARDLYLRNKVRFIYDSGQPTAHIHPKLTTERAPLDLSDSRLRGVSSIHIEYLKNMGVKGSFSVAIIVEEKLWGIISCHHSEANYVSHKARSQCLLIANTLALAAPMIEGLEMRTRELNFYSGLHSIIADLKSNEKPLDKLFRLGESVTNLFSCSGFALVSATKVDLYGLTPKSSDLRLIWNWLKERLDKDQRSTYATDSLTNESKEFEEVKELISGLMVVKVSHNDDGILMFVRPEMLQTILWGGDPRKGLEAKNFQGVINPRTSFETWTEIIKNSSAPWRDFELSGLETFKDLVFDSLVNKEVLIQELNDRLQAMKRLPL